MCVYDMFFAIVVMALLCCHCVGRTRRLIIWPFHIANILSNAFGIWLIVEAEAGLGCAHNEIWIFAVILTSLTFFVVIVLCVGWICTRLGLCTRLRRLISIDDEPYAFNPLRGDSNYF